MTNQQDLLSTHHLSADPKHPFSSWPSLPPNPIGRLILLTPEITAAAVQTCIKTGERFSLDWPVYPSGAIWKNNPRLRCNHRNQPIGGGPHTIKDAEEQGKPYHPCFDDVLELNTQSSTQWDYFLHYSYYGSGLFYGGLTAEQIKTEQTGDIGVAAIAKAGGVQTRALLVDVPYYLSSTGQEPLDPLTFPSNVTMDLPFLKKALEFFKLTPQVGDMLIVRTGFEDTIAEDKMRVDKGEETKLVGDWAGVQASEEMVKWIWETGFVAVGSDNPTFEQWYPQYPDMTLHPILLSGQGIMICELMRLNAVAEECKKQDRWSFFFSSCPLMVEHGVASPPNAVAIF